MDLKPGICWFKLVLNEKLLDNLLRLVSLGNCDESSCTIAVIVARELRIVKVDRLGRIIHQTFLLWKNCIMLTYRFKCFIGNRKCVFCRSNSWGYTRYWRTISRYLHCRNTQFICIIYLHYTSQIIETREYAFWNP